jgi:hypothetical protein
MSSLELKAKTQEELLDWRHALQRAMTPSASSIEAHMVETKKIHMQMSEVIQKHIDALQHDDGSLDSMMGAALQVRRTRARAAQFARYLTAVLHFRYPSRAYKTSAL